MAVTVIYSRFMAHPVPNPRSERLMKSILFSILFVSAVVAVSAADHPPVTGNWDVHGDVAGNGFDLTCSFTQNDKDLSGTCKTDQGTVNAKGSVAEKKVNWTYKSEYNGGPITVTYEGKL